MTRERDSATSRKKTRSADEIANRYYFLAKSRMQRSNVSAIYAIDLPKSDMLCYSEFLKEIKRLARNDKVTAVILEHSVLSSRDKNDLANMLRFSNDFFSDIENGEKSQSRIYFQLQREKVSETSQKQC